MNKLYDRMTNEYRRITDEPPKCIHGERCVECWIVAHPAEDIDLGSGLQ